MGGRGRPCARAVFEQVGGWPAEFRFVHEGIDLAWRVMDAGYCASTTRATSLLLHPAPPARARHAYSPTSAPATASGWPAATSRSRSASLYVATFALRTLPRLRSRRGRAAPRGYRDGLRAPCGPAARLRARTLWRMTRRAASHLVTSLSVP